MFDKIESYTKEDGETFGRIMVGNIGYFWSFLTGISWFLYYGEDEFTFDHCSKMF